MDNYLIKEEILEHYKRPQNYGTLADVHAQTDILNPSCGDSIALQIFVENMILTKVVFQGKGCVISQAAASMLTAMSLKKPLIELERVDKDAMLALIGISLGPTRLRCGLLALEALHAAIALYKKQGSHNA